MPSPPEAIPVNPKTREAIEEAAAREGMTVPTYLDYVARGGPAQRNPWMPFGMMAPPPSGKKEERPSMMDAWRQTFEFMPMMFMMRGLGMPGPGIGPEGGISKRDLEDLLERTTRRSKKEEDEDESPELRKMTRLMMKKAELKMLMGFAGDNPQAQNDMKDLMAKYDSQIEALRGAREKDKEETQAKLEAEREARHQEELAVRDQAINQLGVQVQNLTVAASRPPPAPPSLATQIDEQVKGFTALQSALGALENMRRGPRPEPGKEPDWSDKLGVVLDSVAKAGNQLLQGAGYIAAANQGVPPHMMGAVPPQPGAPAVPADYQQVPPPGAPEAPAPPIAAPPPPQHAPATSERPEVSASSMPPVQAPAPATTDVQVAPDGSVTA